MIARSFPANWVQLELYGPNKPIISAEPDFRDMLIPYTRRIIDLETRIAALEAALAKLEQKP